MRVRLLKHLALCFAALTVGPVAAQAPRPAPPGPPQVPGPTLEILSLFGAGGYRNPTFDTSSPDWAKNVCGGGTWLSGYNPVYEWMPVLRNGSELESDVVAVSGTAINAHRSEDDVWFTHPFGNDLNFDVAPDQAYRSLMSPIRKPDSSSNGRDNSIARARTQYGLSVDNVLHVEMDEGFVPAGYQAQDGDRVAVWGRWIVDCGHDDYGAEIHPPLLSLAAHANGTQSTRVSVVSRPWLASQRFDGTGMFEHLIHQLLRVYPPLLPFPVTDQVEARPAAPGAPFSGLKMFMVAIRPPGPRLNRGDRLVVSYSLAMRTGVTAQLYQIDDATVGLTIVMNDVDFRTAPLPPRTNRVVPKAEINRVRPDVGMLLGFIQGGGTAFLSTPAGAFVLEKGVATDFYPLPNVVDAPPTRMAASAVGAAQFVSQDFQPWPIRGQIEVRWERHVDPSVIAVSVPGADTLHGSPGDQLHRRPPLNELVTRPVEVPANVQWVATGIQLRRGQHFAISATGQWSNAGPAVIGPNGFSNYPYPGTLLAGANLASLVGRVGDQLFSVGGTFDGTSPADGELFLSINDTPGTFADNQGLLSVTVRLH